MQLVFIAIVRQTNWLHSQYARQVALIQLSILSDEQTEICSLFTIIECELIQQNFCSCEIIGKLLAEININSRKVSFSVLVLIE
jgi:hypothetical protein